MMKKTLLSILLLLSLGHILALAQKFGNEWIISSQRYYKLPTSQNGFYRVGYTELIAAGIPLTGIDPRNIKIFHRGEEHAIRIEGEADGAFDSLDYLVFYGKRNDGVQDVELYTSGAHKNPYYNLYSDTTAYFFTWNNSEPGKRIAFFSENNVLGLPPESYHINTLLNLQTSNYSEGLHYPLGLASAETYAATYDFGEGWTGGRIRQGQSFDILFTGLERVVPSGPSPVLELLLTGRNNLSHNVTIEVGPNVSSLRTLETVQFNYLYDTLIMKTLQWSDIAGGAFLCRVKVKNLGVTDQISVTYAQLKSAETLDQVNNVQKTFYIPYSGATRSYIEIQNVPAGSRLFDITDERNILEIGFNTVGSTINTIIPNQPAGKKLILTSQFVSVAKISPASFRTINPVSSEFIIITNKNLRNPTAQYSDVPKAYASYRASSQGGTYDTLLVNVDQLYDMFGYGEISPLAIRRFASYLLSNGNPKFLFIMGKGLAPNYNFYRQNYQTQQVKNHVPTYGFPGSDMRLTSGLSGTANEPAIPTGRIAANTPEVLEAYFNKVKETESLSYDALWRKELIHLSGGYDPAQQNLFKSFVNGFKTIAEGIYLGGKVETISKNTSEPIAIINIAEQINAGKMLVTFFGHSASESTDIDIGKVSDDDMGYHNAGKYPMMVVNGCVAGDMYTNNPNTFGDDWIGTADRGAIGFMAHSGAGLTPSLKRYSDLIYEVAFSDSLFFGKGVGLIQKEAGRRFTERYPVSQVEIAQIQQMALQGDPSVPVFGLTKPDYQVQTENMFVQSLDGNPINAFTDEFLLGIAVQNFGKVLTDSLVITASRKLSNGRDIPLTIQKIAPVYYRDTIYVIVRSVGVEGFGINNFFVTVDPANLITEEVETNNNAVFEYFLPLGSTSNLAPYKFAIVNKRQINLIAQALNPLVKDKSYLFEIDTTNLFNSPIVRRTQVEGSSSARWALDLFASIPEKDTTVFYWRTKFANPDEQEIDSWYLSSFTYIKDAGSGWAMAHIQQYEETAKNHVLLDTLARQWKFEEFNTRIFVRTFGGANTTYPYKEEELIINSTEYLYPTIYAQQFCRDNSLNAVAFDKSTTFPYLVLGLPNVLDPNSCGRQPEVINSFNKASIETNLNVEKYIDAVSQGDYVLLFSIGTVSWSTFPASTIAKLGELGIPATEIQSWANGDPVIIISRKGESTALIIKGDNTSATPVNEQELITEQYITGKANSGTISSRRIGPASGWGEFIQQTDPSEFPVTDEFSYQIYGVNEDYEKSLLIDNVTSRQTDLSNINTASFPYLEIIQKVADEQNLTPPLPVRWMVLYQGLPEGLLTYKANQPISGIEKKEGELHEAAFTFENVSELSFSDSIRVQYTIFNQTDRKNHSDTIALKPLAAGESADFSLFLDTRSKVGLNDFAAFANPYIQPEQDFNNNLINFKDYLNVTVDNTNPLMEVTVDGQFIMDGDIVSPTPMIALRLKDDNEVLFKDDTLGVNLYLYENCEGCQPQRISFSSPNLIWTPASAESDYKLEYQPDRLEDGIYILRAEASDETGNPSGTMPYAVTFEVINESQITNFFPYPNPFSTRTQFVFTLTGSEIPDDLIIQIMTVNGTVVREITMDEIGPIRIGNNKTEYAWDGRDEYGDQLANGVYLYRVKLFLNGLEMKHRATSADKAFVNGFGKLYLLR